MRGPRVMSFCTYKAKHVALNVRLAGIAGSFGHLGDCMTRRIKYQRAMLLKQVSRADIFKLFALPGTTRAAAQKLVARYMGDAPVPPAWSRAGIEGVFGKSIASRWARHIQHRPQGYEPSPTGYRGRRWVVQALADFTAANKNTPMKPTAASCPLILDEFWYFASTTGALREPAPATDSTPRA